jgi:DHA1 family bicyclomycin/chloramphenicol resistance-like MFS transporter
MSSSSTSSAASAHAVAVPPYLILFIGALIAIGPLSIDMYLPAMPAMAQSFGVGIVRMNDTLSMYLVGYGIGQFFGGAFSDQIGRKRVGLIGLVIFVLASVAIGLSATVEQVQWFRFVQAIGAGFGTVICFAIVRDVYPVHELGKRMAMVTLVMLASPAIAPALGAQMLRFGWHTIFFFKAAYATALFLFYALAVPETRAGVSWSKLSILSTLKQCWQVIRYKNPTGGKHPITFAFTGSFSAAVFMTFITNASFAYIGYFHVSEQVFPVYFGVGVVGMIATNFLSMRKLNLNSAPQFFRYGLLIQICSVTFLLLVVLAGAPSIWLVVLPVAVIVSCFGLIGPSGTSQYMSHYGALAGSASSLYTTMLFSSGAVFGAVSGVFFDGTLRPMAITMFVASAIANLLAFTTGAKFRKEPAPLR